MTNFFLELFDWSEVWAPLIPLLLPAKYKDQPSYFRPVVVYLWLAFVIDLLIDVGWKVKPYAPDLVPFMPLWLTDNNYLYNVHSIVRFICFVTFFRALKLPFLLRFQKIIPVVSVLFLLVNFLFFEGFFQKNKFSSRLLTVEAGLLLFYCLQYFLYKMREEKITPKQPPEFWVVMGLSIYVVLNFFIFLFYGTLIDKKMYSVATALWNVHNVAFIIFCFFIAKAFATKP